MIESIESVFIIFAIVIGGIWAYFNFIKGRIYHQRLEPRITAEVLHRDGKQYVMAKAKLQNVGLSEVRIKQEGSGLRVLSYDPLLSAHERKDGKWQHLVTLPVFTEHAWVESREEIEDPHLIEIPRTAAIALRLELRIVSKKKLCWTAATVVDVTHV